MCDPKKQCDADGLDTTKPHTQTLPQICLLFAHALELINYKEIVLTREGKFNEIFGENSFTSDQLKRLVESEYIDCASGDYGKRGKENKEFDADKVRKKLK